MGFKEWLRLQETGTTVAAVGGGDGSTSTSDIAQVKSPLFGGKKKKDDDEESDDEDDEDDIEHIRRGNIGTKSKKDRRKNKSISIDTVLDKL